MPLQTKRQTTLSTFLTDCARSPDSDVSVTLPIGTVETHEFSHDRSLRMAYGKVIYCYDEFILHFDACFCKCAPSIII